jgi:hypothetical protein
LTDEHDTPLKPLTALTSLGVLWLDHVVPPSDVVTITMPPAVSAPTASQNVADAQETPVRSVMADGYCPLTVQAGEDVELPLSAAPGCAAPTAGAAPTTPTPAATRLAPASNAATRWATGRKALPFMARRVTPSTTSRYRPECPSPTWSLDMSVRLSR